MKAEAVDSTRFRTDWEMVRKGADANEPLAQSPRTRVERVARTPKDFIFLEWIVFEKRSSSKDGSNGLKVELKCALVLYHFLASPVPLFKVIISLAHDDV